MDNSPVIVNEVYNAPVTSVWEALTDVNEMRKWYFNIAAFKPETGYSFSFTGTSNNITFVHRCVVTEVIENRKIAYSWRYEGYPGNSDVSFELHEVEGQTNVRLTHSGIETFPYGINELRRENFEAGWKHILKVSLKNYLEKR